MTSDTLLTTMRSLSDIMDEETALLERGEWPVDLASLSAAKLRLIGTLEALSAEQERQDPDWLQSLGAEQRRTLLAVAAAMREAAAVNAAVLVRQIDLSQELVGEIAGEARRLGGARQQTYRRTGKLQQHDGSAPVAVNTRL